MKMGIGQQNETICTESFSVGTDGRIYIKVAPENIAG